MKEDILDKAVSAVQSQGPGPASVEAAVQRVGDRLAGGVAESPLVDEAPAFLRGCADVQSLVPAFVAGRLSPARALLVEDHARSCVPCRRVLKAVRSGQPVEAPAAPAASLVIQASASTGGVEANRGAASGCQGGPHGLPGIQGNHAGRCR